MNAPVRDTTRTQRTQQRIRETRARLDEHVREAAVRAAPSRLIAAGVDAVKAGAGERVERVSAMAANPDERRPLLTGLGALLSLLAGLWMRRRDRLPGYARTRYAHSGTTATAVRAGSPWLGVLLAVVTAYLRRTAHPVR